MNVFIRETVCVKTVRLCRISYIYICIYIYIYIYATQLRADHRKQEGSRCNLLSGRPLGCISISCYACICKEGKREKMESDNIDRTFDRKTDR